ncbi:zinc ribbon domain-containing protein [Bacillus benzoevorans]|uniref:Putative membrane protein YvbJ n=2 Tax=Bacillus benzoevorans TaxID=1456 RepID=A0A7X0HTU2_9BACI|nr:putative membrane protein YvbJ [Bacillus benzoevorans]
MAFCSNCGEQIDSTKPFCASCGARIDQDYASRQNKSSISDRNSSDSNKIKFKRVNWRVYFLSGLVLLLAAIYLIFDPFNKDVAFAKWGELTKQEKVTLVTDFMQENYPDISTPTAAEIIRYCNLLYKDAGDKNEAISSILSEFVELDKEKRIAAIAALSGDIIEDESRNDE